MTWIIITPEAITDMRLTTILEEARNAASAKGQSDPVPAAIARVVAEVRSVIGFKGPAMVDARAGTIPENLTDLVSEAVIRRLRQVVGYSFSDDEKEAERTYQSRLASLRDGSWPVDRPDQPASPPAQSAGGAASSSHARSATSRALNGI